MGTVLTVNVSQLQTNPDPKGGPTGIGKRPIDGVVAVRTPGPMKGGLGSGLIGDAIGNPKFHGGDDQAVYAYAREDLDEWEASLDRALPNGEFGENFTTEGVEVTGARIGERWRVGTGGLVLEVSRPRTPCRTFAARLDIKGWMKTFTAKGAPGAYLRVIEPGPVRAGDAIEVVERPDHDVTIGMVFRAMTTEPGLLPSILVADALAEPVKKLARRRS